MPIVSIISATHDGRWVYYKDALESVLSQQLPPGWKLEWLIQVDGVDTQVHETLQHMSESTDNISIGRNHAQLGPGGTRNLALARAKGELVRVLDSDDMMLPGSLGKQIEIFTQHNNVHWCAFQPYELFPDGSKKPDKARIPTGLTKPGVLNATMEKLKRCPVHCAGLMLRTTTLRAFGGWCALPVGEDVTMLSAISEIYHGWVMDEFGWLYRKHDQQMTNHLRASSWSTMGEHVSKQRVSAIRELSSKK